MILRECPKHDLPLVPIGQQLRCMETAGVAYFHKQHGGLRPGGDNRLDGIKHEAYPDMEQPALAQGVLAL